MHFPGLLFRPLHVRRLFVACSSRLMQSDGVILTTERCSICQVASEQWLRAEQILVNRMDYNSAHAVSYNGNKEVLYLLLDWGAHININIPATKKDVPPHKNFKPRDVSKNKRFDICFTVNGQLSISYINVIS
jgi:hypothetical protein